MEEAFAEELDCVAGLLSIGFAWVDGMQAAVPMYAQVRCGLQLMERPRRCKSAIVQSVLEVRQKGEVFQRSQLSM